MKISTKDNIKGKLEESKGKVKEVAGKFLQDPQLQSEGIFEKRGGQVRQKISEVEKALGD